MEKNKNLDKEKVLKEDKDFIPEQELNLLLEVLPERIRIELKKFDLKDLIEVVMDRGRIPEARFFGGKIVDVGIEVITLGEINYVVGRIGNFSSDNRAGIERTLHRISCMKSRRGDIIGLTCRVGRTVNGTIDPIRDIIDSKQSVLLLGPPGVGKTTRLREITRVLADELHKRVIVIDTSNEIAGDGDIPHSGIGRSRRMQVARPELQHAVMIEAVENHTPEVIVIDEIGTELEAAAARTIAERGVQLIGTAHGVQLENILKNPTLSDLIGGIQTVTLGDEEAKKRGTQKTILERQYEPTFNICIEIIDHDSLAIHNDVAKAVDELLRGKKLFPEIRKMDRQSGKVEILAQKEPKAQDGEVSVSRTETPLKEYNIYPYAVSRGQLERVIRALELPTKLSKTLDEANVIFALKNYTKQGAKIIELAKKHKIPLFVVKNNTIEGIQEAIKSLYPNLVSDFVGETAVQSRTDDVGSAIEEVKASISLIMQTDQSVDLNPQNAGIRKMQYDLIRDHKLDCITIGQEPNRRIRIFPPPKPGDNI